MLKLRLCVGVLVVCLFGAGWLVGQDKKGDDKPPPVKGTLPAYYGKLGLRDDQKTSVYRIRSEYRGKIAELRRQINRLQREEKAALEKVLTPEQLKRLRELRAGESEKETPPGKPTTKDKATKDK
jgi:hypothetical protein